MGIKRYQIDRRVESLEDQVQSRRFILDEPAHELACSVLRPQHTSSVMLRNAVQVSVACSVPSAHTHTHTLGCGYTARCPLRTADSTANWRRSDVVNLYPLQQSRVEIPLMDSFFV